MAVWGALVPKANQSLAESTKEEAVRQAIESADILIEKGEGQFILDACKRIPLKRMMWVYERLFYVREHQTKLYGFITAMVREGVEIEQPDKDLITLLSAAGLSEHYVWDESRWESTTEFLRPIVFVLNRMEEGLADELYTFALSLKPSGTLPVPNKKYLQSVAPVLIKASGIVTFKGELWESIAPDAATVPTNGEKLVMLDQVLSVCERLIEEGEGQFILDALENFPVSNYVSFYVDLQKLRIESPELYEELLVLRKSGSYGIGFTVEWRPDPNFLKAIEKWEVIWPPLDLRSQEEQYDLIHALLFVMRRIEDGSAPRLFEFWQSQKESL